MACQRLIFRHYLFMGNSKTTVSPPYRKLFFGNGQYTPLTFWRWNSSFGPCPITVVLCQKTKKQPEIRLELSRNSIFVWNFRYNFSSFPGWHTYASQAMCIFLPMHGMLWRRNKKEGFDKEGYRFHFSCKSLVSVFSVLKHSIPNTSCLVGSFTNSSNYFHWRVPWEELSAFLLHCSMPILRLDQQRHKQSLALFETEDLLWS